MEQMSLFDGSKKFVVDKPIRLISLFSGYDSQEFALKYLGVNYEHWKTCEWAVKSIQALKDAHYKNDDTDYSKDFTQQEIVDFLCKKGISANYNEPMTYEQIKRLGEQKQRQIYNNIKATHNLVNIQQAKASDLEIVDVDKYCYLMTYSFPCFTADSLVLTRDGFKKICDIEYGDFVLSHDNNYHKVVNIFNNGTHDIYKINAMGVDEIKTTLNHKFYVREKYRKGHKSIRCFREPIWKELKDLTKDDYLGVSINQNNTSIVSNKLPMQHNSFWWLIGRYLGDGWIRQQGGIIICCDKKELNEITNHLDKLDWNYNVVNERTVFKIHIPKKALSDFVKQFGNNAGTKHLTRDILDLPIHYLEPFIKGYISADGCFTNGVYKATSISRELIYGIAQCVAKVYRTPYRIYKVEPPKTKIIEDRLVNQNSWYQLVFKTEKKKQDKAFYEDGYIWYPIKSINYIGKDCVYDIEVEDSHSFTVQNTIVHNCQDLSKAGLGKGMEKGSGTRSGMLWEVERILDECNGNLPQILLMENVPDVIGSKNIIHFAKWLEKLEKLGYHCYWQVLNAKDFGVPQNRERCFMVSLLGDYLYEFPKKQKLEIRLKDILEKEVDEKYYLSSKAIEGSLKTNFASSKLENKIPKNGICPTIMARDYKDPKCILEPKCIGGIGDKNSNNGTQWHQQDRIYDNNIAISVTTGFNPYYVSKEKNLKTKLCNELISSGKVKENDVIRHNFTTSKNGDCIQSNNEVPTLDTRCDCLGVVVNNEPIGCEIRKDEGIRTFSDNCIGTLRTIDACGDKAIIETNYRIRKLTPKECFRLMGVKDEDFDKVAQNQSNASLYHLAGDSIVVNVLMAIFGQLFDKE